jgi:hypothetical protein
MIATAELPISPPVVEIDSTIAFANRRHPCCGLTVPGNGVT